MAPPPPPVAIETARAKTPPLPVQPAPAAAPERTGPISLTATALDSCILRVQVDSNARSARRYRFTRRGETRSWTADESFRVLAQPAANVELRLNGRLVPVPADGRTVVLDRSMLEPEGRTSTAPARTPTAPARRPRSTTRAAKPSAEPPATASSLQPQHAAGPP